MMEEQSKLAERILDQITYRIFRTFRIAGFL